MDVQSLQADAPAPAAVDVARHGTIYFLARGAAGLLGMATLAVFTRMLVPAEYGLYALGVTVATIASSLTFQWLVVAIARFVPAYLSHIGILIAAARRPFVYGGLLSLAGFLLALPLRRVLGVSPLFLLLVLLATVELGVHNLFLQVANSQGRPLRFFLLGLLKGAGTLGVGAGLMLLIPTHTGALLGIVGGLLIAVVGGNPLRGARPERSDEVRKLEPQLMRYGLPLLWTYIGSLAVDFADRLLIAGIIGPAAVGRYSAAYDLSSQAIGAINSVLFLAAFPAVVHAFEHQGADTARGRMRSLGRSLIGLALPATVGFAVVSADVAEVLLGASFRDDAARIMPVLALAAWLNGFKNFYLDVTFQLRRKTGYQAWIALSMAGANIALNVFLLRRYGIAAAAWATLAAFALGTVLSFFLGRGLMAMHPLRVDFLKALAASGLMVVAVVALPGQRGVALLAAKLLFGGTVYLAAAWMLDIAGARRWLSGRRSPSQPS